MRCGGSRGLRGGRFSGLCYHFLLLSRRALVICEAKSLIFKTNNILDALDLTLEENSAIFEPIGIAIVEGYLPEYLADSGYDQHLISGQNSLEALRKRA